MSLVDVEERLAGLEMSLRRIRASQRERAPRKFHRRRRTCDECHAPKPRNEFDGMSPTCRTCEHELSTPRPRRAS